MGALLWTEGAAFGVKYLGSFLDLYSFWGLEMRDPCLMKKRNGRGARWILLIHLLWWKRSTTEQAVGLQDFFTADGSLEQQRSAAGHAQGTMELEAVVNCFKMYFMTTH